MPKVETSLQRGDDSTFKQNYVSNTIGNNLGSSLKMNKIRQKRDLNNFSYSDSDELLPHRRVVKKLIRIEPIYEQRIDRILDTDEDHTEAPVAKRRKFKRKLVIKKKKRKLNGNFTLSNLPEDHLQQATKPRRKVVVTKKRLLPNRNKTVSLTPSSTLEPIISTTVSEKPPIIEDYDEDQEEYTEENIIVNEETDENNQNVPDYEPYFPELTESLEAPILLLKTTVLTSTELLTRTILQSRLRTYTFVVTRVNGDEQIVTSTTEVKPQTKTSILTEPITKLTTLTLLDFDATSTLTPLQTIPPLDPQLNQENGRAYEEARYNLATRVMSNGVEVIVAGDKSTLPGEPDVKRVLPSTIYKPVTLKPSTLSDHMMMMLPQDASNIDSLSSSLVPNQFVTKTCLTTFTYLTTYLEGSTTTVSSHEQVVSNIATEERNTGKILPTPAMGITLTQYPNLSVGVFHTTYTYLNTILDGEQPLVVSSKHTVTNTVTAPDDYLSLLQPSETSTALRDTNTYYSTIALEKTLYEGEKTSVVSTNEVVTQVVITESIPPKATSVMTSYIALDIEDPEPISLSEFTTTDVVKTYFVTYTYYNTLIQNGETVVNTNVSTSSDIVTEKLYLHPKRTSSVKASIKDDKKKHKIDLSGESFYLLATKSYQTTFTYFTTLLQEDNTVSPTIISSRSKVVENVVTETIDPNLLDKKNLGIIKSEIKDGSNSIIKVATLQDGQKIEITAVANLKEKIKPTKVLPIEKTELPDLKLEVGSSPSVITGSTIVFVDDDPFAPKPTPSLTETKTIISSEVVKKTKVFTATSKVKRTSKTKNKSSIRPTTSSKVQTSSKVKNQDGNKKPAKTPVSKPANQVPDLLGLGSINIKALTPVLNAMAGLIETNLKSNRRNDQLNVTTTSRTVPKNVVPAVDTQNRSPIYIPVGGLADDFEIAESQNIATFHLQETVDGWKEGDKEVKLDKPTHESALINGGIPISPGEVITANSDVIVGKPGRILPRVPSIPISQVKDVPIDMKPPPVPWPKRNHEYKHIPVRNENPIPNIVHAPNKDDYVGPPPPLKDSIRVDSHKHIPLSPPERPFDQSSAQGQKHSVAWNQKDHHFNEVYAQGQNNYGVSYSVNEVQEQNMEHLQESIQKNYELAAKQSYPVYAQGQAPIVPSTVNFNIHPSILNNPLVLPEVIERSTGQPLLVNIQPSQVAFVNIPYNRTTALIYGGSTEPHKNGQYFDDPSPYPDHDFSVGESYNPQQASVYPAGSNQKQVNSFITVGNQIINVEPVGNVQNVPIYPSKPINQNSVLVGVGQNQEVNINVPPISFGMVQQGNDFNAHVINHGVNFPVPLVQYEVSSEQPKPQGGKVEEIENLKPPERPKPKYPHPPKRNFGRPRPRPDKLGLSEFMNPPPFVRRPQFGNRHRPQKPLPIPLIPQDEQNQRPVYDVHQNDDSLTPEDDDDDDLINESGEVIQESNSRPLLPGEIPIEILNSRTTTEASTNKSVRFPSSFVRFPNLKEKPVVSNQRPTVTQINDQRFNDHHIPINERPNDQRLNEHQRPHISSRPHGKPNGYQRPQRPNHQRPIDNQNHNIVYHVDPIVRPENQQTNQIIPLDEVLPNQYPHYVPRPSTQSPLVENSTLNTILKAPEVYPVIPVNYQQQNENNQPGSIIYVRDEPITANNHEISFIKHQLQQEIVKETRPSPSPAQESNFNTVEVYAVPQYSSTHKPLVSYEVTTPSNTGKVNNRPKVTSLPIDHHTTTSTVHTYEVTEGSSQTEKPFKPQKGNKPTNEINIKTEPKPDLNIGEIVEDGNGTAISEMEIMKPPPPPPMPEVVMKQPDVKLQPPKIEINSPSGNINRVPSISTESPNDLEMQASSSKPFVPKPSENMVPPPKSAEVEVLGMSPPPLTTLKPRGTKRPLTTTEAVPAVDLNPPKPKLPSRSEFTTTERPKFTRPRRPFTRKPYYRPSTFASVELTSTLPSITTTHPIYNIINRFRNKTRIEEANKAKITPSPPISSSPKMEVIIGNPNQKETTTENQFEIYGSEVAFKENVLESTSLLKHPPKLTGSLTTTDVINTATHHAGNEVKIVDDTTSKKVVPLTSSTTKTVLPTRYITHTKTSTVTITKTTVVKTLGSPPSTLTLLVTKTEKHTVVDTVTEFHTLLKPTSVIETVTTTVQPSGSSLYPADAYGSSYPSIHIKPTVVEQEILPSISFEDLSDDDLEEFIINEADPPAPSSEAPVLVHNDTNDSILVVMTDKNNKGSVITIPNVSHETQERDEIIANNEVNNVLLGGIFLSHPTLDNSVSTDKCEPECKAARNELCQRVEGIMRCVCRPGFARMFPDRPCIPTYTYDLKVNLNRIGRETLKYNEELANPNSTEFVKLLPVAHEAIDRMVMQSDLRDIYHGVEVHSFEPSEERSGIISKFYLQLSDNIEEGRLEDIFKKYLRNNNYSLGGTEVYASKSNLDELKALDFNECTNPKFHDCSENAQCFNLKGTYTCSCKEGYADLSENQMYPGRVCSAEQIGCERCNYHGTCYSRGEDQVICECFQWYAGESCHINLKVLLIALVTLGAIMVILLLVCIIMTCLRRKPQNAGAIAGMAFLPQRVVRPSANRSTLDRRAMIQDTSSEDSRSETNTLPYVAKAPVKKPKGALKKTPMQIQSDVENGNSTINTLSFPDQKDRSLTVMIPRAKYHPAPPTSPLLNYTTFDARKPSVPSTNEAKLLSYLDAGPSPLKSESKRKYSNTNSDSYIEEKPTSRKTSGALISAGFEVSATVVNNMGHLGTLGNMGTLGTTCGTEADRSENATLIQKISADLLSSTGTRSQFNTLREDDIDPLTNWMDINPQITTISEARSYDETTIPPPMKSFRTDYDSKPSSQHHNDEANTMAERDLGSTFLLPHTHLYKPDRGSDISGFESL